MKILTLSDLHHDLYRDEGHDIPDLSIDEDVDLVIILGDIDTADEATQWAVQQSNNLDLPFLYIPGNHEFYGSTLSQALEVMKENTKDSRVTLLNNDYTVIGDTLFIGATLWTDQQLENSDLLEQKMTDYHAIEIDDGDDTRPLKKEDTLKLHYDSVNFIESMLEREFKGNVVVASHHAPHTSSLSEHYINKKRQAGYASDLSFLFEEYNINLWLHGHTHHKVDNTVHGTRIYANPKGTPRDLSSQCYQQEAVSLTPIKVKPRPKINYAKVHLL